MDFTEYKVDVPEGRSGNWSIERFEVPDTPTIENLRIAMHGRTTVPPGTYTRLLRNGHSGPVMSDTPAEVLDCLDIIWAAKGRVLLNGLGLGMVLKACLAKDSVTRVDVVELSPDVLTLVAPTYEDDPRVYIHHGNALTYKWPPNTRWDVVWHDIWDDICHDNLPDMIRLHRSYGRRCRQQASWAREEVESRW